jgi:hypothetical protein
MGIAASKVYPRLPSAAGLHQYVDATVQDGWLSPDDWVALFDACSVGGTGSGGLGFPALQATRPPPKELVAILEEHFSKHEELMSPFTRAFASLACRCNETFSLGLPGP